MAQESQIQMLVVGAQLMSELGANTRATKRRLLSCEAKGAFAVMSDKWLSLASYVESKRFLKKIKRMKMS